MATTKTAALTKLAAQYFKTRPNLDKAHKAMAIFFLASPGSGKTTLRKAIVERFGATYVCNDEVRDLIAADPNAEKADVEIKEVVDTVRDRILADTENHFIVFDNNISAYYMHDDSYINVAKRAGMEVFIVAVDLSREVIKQRIITRNRHDTQKLLDAFELHQSQRESASQKLRPDFTMTTAITVEDLLGAIQERL